MYTGTSLLSQKSARQGTWIAPTERSGLGGVSLRSPGLRGVVPRNSRKSVWPAYRIYWRLQHARSCWFLHCADAGTAKKVAQKKERSHNAFPFMMCLPPELRHTYAVGEDRAGGAQAAASAYFTDFSYVRTNLLLVNKQMAWRPGGLPRHGIGFPPHAFPSALIYPT